MLMVIGSKWKSVILYKLAREEVLRFSDLGREIMGITERMLTRQLRELELDGLFYREVYKPSPPKVEYFRTEIGGALIPILLSMREWGGYEERLEGAGRFTGEEHEPRDRNRLLRRERLALSRCLLLPAFLHDGLAYVHRIP